VASWVLWDPTREIVAVLPDCAAPGYAYTMAD
jgi:hypothetical protein